VNNWKVIFATVVIFGAGVITGGLLVNYVHNSRPMALYKPEGRPPATNPVVRLPEAPKLKAMEFLSRQFLQRLDEELHLAPNQHEAIQKIVSEGQSQVRKVIQDARLEIREVLTPEQRKCFDELVKRPARKPVPNTNAPAILLPATNAPAP
jgi:hypothetical protein